MMPLKQTCLTLSGIRKSFGRKIILDNAELDLSSGSCGLLCGKNGSGKTTLLRIAAGLEKPDAGDVSTGRGTHPWRKYRQQLRTMAVYLHQEPYMFDGDVISNLQLAVRNGHTRRQHSESVDAAIEWAALEPIARNHAKTLSGGERQRVAIARAWLRQPEIMLLDEPMANMDQESRSSTIRLLHSLKQQGMALMITSHDPAHFETLTDSMLQLSDGRIQSFRYRDNVTPLHGRLHGI